MIDLRLDCSLCRAGDRLSGQFIWQPDDPSKPPKDARVNLAWFTEGRGSRDRLVVEHWQIPLEKLSQLQQRPHLFNLTIPPDVPITYDGYLFRLMWEVEVQIIFPGMFRPKDTAVCAVQMSF